MTGIDIEENFTCKNIKKHERTTLKIISKQFSIGTDNRIMLAKDKEGKIRIRLVMGGTKKSNFECISNPYPSLTSAKKYLNDELNLHRKRFQEERMERGRKLYSYRFDEEDRGDDYWS